MFIHQSSIQASATEKYLKIQDGHEIVGFAVETDAQGYITWIDIKTWKPLAKI